MRVVITDCDHDSLGPEREVAERYGIDLVLAQGKTVEDVVKVAAEADGIVVQYAPVTAEVMAELPNLKAIGRYGVGVDTVDIVEATRLGIAVCNVPDYGTESVSDHAIALALTVSRGVTQLDRAIRAGGWGFAQVRPLRAFAGRTMGIVGMGLIGAATARKALGLGFEVVGTDVLREVGTQHQGVRMTTLDEVLSVSDILSLHVPLTDDTRHLVGAAELAQLKQGAVLINTSRGGVVDTEALIEALRAKHLYGAGLDVHEQEPLPLDHALIEIDNVVLTPHTAWYNEESYYELKRRSVENVAQVVTGEKPRDILNPEVLT